MDQLTVKPISPTKKELRKFVDFGVDLYKGNDCYVPPLRLDDVNNLLPSVNPAFDFCEAQSFMAYRGSRAVGRVTGIINHAVNERTGSNDLRFANLEFVDDPEVADALFSAVEDWGRQKGMTSIVGPMGFTDLDHEGMLVEGFDELGTMATIYNFPYYPAHMERMGFKKDVDWVEFQMTVPPDVPDKYRRIADIVTRKYGLRTLHYKHIKELARDYGQALFDLINRAYDKLYGYSPLTQRQIDYYIKMYLPILRLDCISIIVDADSRLVGVGISMPSFSRALRRANGRIFPFGWWHLLKALRAKTDTVDLMIVAIDPEYQSKGVNALLFADLIPNYIKHGFRWAESNLELEENSSVQLQWQYFERRQHRRRRAYRRPL